MGIRGDVGGRVGGPHRYVVGDARRLDLRRGAGPGPVGHDAVDLVGALGALRERRPSRIGGQVGPSHRVTEATEVGVGPGHDAHVLVVRGGVVVERRAVREAIALTAADETEAVVARHRPLEDTEDRAVKRRVDNSPAPCAVHVAVVERGDRGLGREGAGEVVGDRHARADRRAVGVPGQMEQSAVADAHAVEAGSLRVGPVLAEDRDAHPHQARVAVCGPDVPALHGAGTEVLAHDVGRGREPAEQVLALGPAQVAGDALAAAPLDRPEERVRLLVRPVARRGERPDGAHEVAPARLLDLDDLRAQLAQETGAEGGGDARAGVDDPHAVERALPVASSAGRARHSGASPRSRSAKTSFIDVFCLRASSASSAVAVLWVQ